MTIYKFAKFLSFFWLMGAVSLLIKGIKLSHFEVLPIALGILLGVFKYQVAFTKMIKKYFEDQQIIQSIHSLTTLFQSVVFRKIMLITVLMLMFARAFQLFQIEEMVRSTVDIAVGSALLLGSIKLFGLRPKEVETKA